MTVRIIEGDCRDVLRTLPSDSVDCIVTSPPYWRQRDYGMPEQIGLELSPEHYIAQLVAVFNECRRILRPKGTCWVNLGDKWASGGNGGGGKWMLERGHAWDHARGVKGWRKPPPGYKDKDLVGIPWLFAFAARAEGWYLRQCNIWAKPNCMPESVKDRSTASHEYVFQLCKCADYWYDQKAARTQRQPHHETRLAQSLRSVHDDAARLDGRRDTFRRKRLSEKQRGHSRRHVGFNDRWEAVPIEARVNHGANLRSVWWISPAQFREEHYAVMPERLAEICIASGCPPGGTVLDPFGGAATTALVAQRLGRHAILVELNPKTVRLAQRRIRAA